MWLRSPHDAPHRNNSARRLGSVLLLVLVAPAASERLYSYPNKVELPTVSAGDRLGCSMATIGDVALVGACDAHVNGVAKAGVVHTFRKGVPEVPCVAQPCDRYTTGTVLPPASKVNALFGTSIAVSQDESSGLLLIGAPDEGVGYLQAVGFVYVFRFALQQDEWAPFEYAYVTKLYAEDALDRETIRALTLATPNQQAAWIRLFESDTERAPMGRSCKAWITGGTTITTDKALFDLEAYEGQVTADLFGEHGVFADADQFWEAHP